MNSVTVEYLLSAIGRDGYDAASVLHGQGNGIMEDFSGDPNKLEDNVAGLANFFEHASPGVYRVQLYKAALKSVAGAKAKGDIPKLLFVRVENGQVVGQAMNQGPDRYADAMAKVFEVRLEMERMRHAHELAKLSEPVDNSEKVLSAFKELLAMASKPRPVTEPISSPTGGHDFDSDTLEALARLKQSDPELFAAYRAQLLANYGNG